MKKSFHLHMVSDATGETLLSAGRAVGAQYADHQMVEHIHPMIRNTKQLERVLIEISSAPGIVLYTMIDEKLGFVLTSACKNLNLPCVAVLQPLLEAFSTYLGAPSQHRASAQHALTADYFQRIEAIDFTIDHDDGQMPEDLPLADVILVGISRTSKTPTSIYLAHRGLKAANVPLVKGIPLPEALFKAKQNKIIGLVASSERISTVRKSRNVGQGFGVEVYTDRVAIQEELTYARHLFERYQWPILDVSRRSIEETAAAILSLLENDNE